MVVILESRILPSVRSAMRPAVWGFIDESVLSIVDKMLTYDIGAIIIMRESVPVGIITEKDILERIVKTGRNPRETIAQDIMTTPIIIVDPDMSITDAINLMGQKKVRRLVVFDKVTLGIVTIRRLLEAVVASSSA